MTANMAIIVSVLKTKKIYKNFFGELKTGESGLGYGPDHRSVQSESPAGVS